MLLVQQQGLLQLLHMAGAIPQFSPRHDITREALIDLALDLRFAEVADALAEPAWFDAELRRLVSVGEAGGELDAVLVRIGERYERQVGRMVERLAALLEPAVIVVLAFFIGTVVMAAVLPLIRLQEVL